MVVSRFPFRNGSLCAALLLLLAACATPRGTFPVQTGHVEVEGARLVYDVAGSGPAIVLVHGGLVDRRLWDDQLRDLARGHRVIRYDLRGYGGSSAVSGAFSHVDDLGRVMDHLQVPRAVVVGLSLGGMIAADYALEHPERVSALVLAAAPARGYRAPAEAPSPAAQRLGRVWGAIRTAAATSPSAAIEMILDSTAMAPRPPAARVRMRTMLSANLRGLMNSDPSMVRWPAPATADRLGELRVPTLVLVGDRDDAPLLAMSAVLAGRIPGARLITLRGAGHHLNLDRPDDFSRHVRELVAASR